MSDDGANLGVRAGEALKVVLGGGPQPTTGGEAAPANVRSLLENAWPLDDLESRVEGEDEVWYSKRTGAQITFDYSKAAECAGRAVLDFMDAHPDLADSPLETEYPADIDWGTFGTSEFPGPLRKGMYDVMKEHGVNLSLLGLTGFMWGWAYNAARAARGEEPQPNPAII